MTIKENKLLKYRLDKKELNFNEIKLIIKNKNGILLYNFTEYKNYKDKFYVQCGAGHIWKTWQKQLRNNKWCPFCDENHKYNQIVKIIEGYGGKILIKLEEYKNMNCKFLVKCKNLHIWKTNGNNLTAGSWCNECKGRRNNVENKKITIGRCQDLAIKMGGKLLSTKICESKEKLIWECGNGHIFNKSFDTISYKNGWCNICSLKYKSEEICRIYFETIFNNKFPKFRGEWLINRHGNNLELDGYCKELGVAFEHNGNQHYDERFYKNKKTYNRIKTNDQDKYEACKNKNIKLIIIDQLVEKTTLYELENTIKNAANEYNIPIKSEYFYNLSNLSKTNTSLNRLKIVEDFCKLRGGKLLSGDCLNANSILVLECGRGHIWNSSYIRISYNKYWCKKCGHLNNIKRLDINKEKLEQLYFIENKTLKEISLKFNVDKRIIINYFKNFGIQTKSQISNSLNQELLQKLYIYDNLTLLQIADIYKISKTTISYKLQKFNLKKYK